MRVLVTGADGFIGSHLTEELVKKGYQVRAFVYYNSFNNWGWLDTLPENIMKDVEIFQGDIRDPNGVEEAVKGVDAIFHLAALIAIPFSYHSPDTYVDTNIKGTLNILQAARKQHTDRVLVTSTSEVYGTAQYVPIDEKHPFQGQSPYSATKIGADRLAESFYRSFQLPVTIVRPFNTYGPRQSARAVIPAIISQLLAGKEEIKRSLESEGVSVAEDREIPYALHIKGYDYLSKLGSFRKGYFYVQDISSMEVAEWAKPQIGDVVIDVCAAPGGKAIHMAEKLEGSGRVIARDLTEHKVGIMRENIARSGLPNIEAQQWDASVYDETVEGAADIVLADLPCSGLGVLGRKTDLKYRMTPAMQNDLVKLQRDILGTVRAYVKPGGKLVYSTCTVNKKENEENARWFLKEYPEFTLLKEQQRFPGRNGGDGFYIALFQKRGTCGNGLPQ